MQGFTSLNTILLIIYVLIKYLSLRQSVLQHKMVLNINFYMQCIE